MDDEKHIKILEDTPDTLSFTLDFSALICDKCEGKDNYLIPVKVFHAYCGQHDWAEESFGDIQYICRECFRELLGIW